MHEALERLCRTYWYPLYAYVRRRGHPPEAAKDLTQGFFADLLERRDLATVAPERGRFRAFLLAALGLLEPLLTGSPDAPVRADIAARFGISVGAVDVALHRLRRRYGEIIRELIAETVADPAEADAEIRHLRAVLGR